jgi:uncharacterized protein YutE (UPF0331/DUF86 family)
MMETLFDMCMRMIHRAVTPPTGVTVECIRYLADPNTLPELDPTTKQRIISNKIF